ncbi:MAG: phage portal protein, partial [Burkholderiales bacterium]
MLLLDDQVVDPGPEDIERLEQRFMSRFSGPTKAGRPVILTNVKDIKQFQQSTREMDFNASSEQARDMILALFKVPKQIAGFSDGMTYGSNLAVIQWFCANTINPLTHFLGEVFTEKIAVRFDERRRIRIYWDDCAPDDPAQKLAEHQAYLTSGVLTINEVRQELGYAPYEHGGDDPILPMGSAPMPLNTGEQELDLSSFMAPPPTEEVPGAEAPSANGFASNGRLSAALDAPQRKGSWFEECPRDDEGRCKPSGAGGAGGGAAKPSAGNGDEPSKPKPGKPSKSKPSRAGFREIVRRDDGSYAHADGTPLPAPAAERVRSLRLPPAWSGVQISHDQKSPLQAVGYDKKGREQRVYSAAHGAAAAAEKFARVKALVAELPKIDAALRSTVAGPEGPAREAAATLLLMRKTGFRIGSERDTKTEHEALGATTLTANNVKVQGNTVTFDFIGKKGVQIQQTIEDAELAGMLSPRLSKPGKIFDTNDTKVRDYLHSVGGSFKPKDLRTTVASETALAEIAKIEAPVNDKAFAKARAQVGKVVAAKLGNTPAVALASYIPPEVFGPWQAG